MSQRTHKNLADANNAVYSLEEQVSELEYENSAMEKELFELSQKVFEQKLIIETLQEIKDEK